MVAIVFKEVTHWICWWRTKHINRTYLGCEEGRTKWKCLDCGRTYYKVVDPYHD